MSESLTRQVADLQLANAELERNAVLLEAQVRETEEKLAFERNLLRELLDNSPDHIYFKDSQSRFLRSGRAQARQFGVASPAVMVGKSDADFISIQHAQVTLEEEKEIIRTGRPLIAKLEREVWDDGRPDSWVVTSKMPLRNQDGEIIGTFGVSKDITGLKHAEEALGDSQAFYHSLVEQIPAGIYRKDVGGCYTFVNSYFCQLKQLASDQILGRTATEVHREQSQNRNANWCEDLAVLGDLHHQQIMQSGQPIRLHDITSAPDGHPQHFHVIKSPVLDTHGKIIGSQGVMFDITELKRTESELREASALLETLLQNTTDFIYFKDKQSRFVHFSKSMLDMLGLREPEELRGKTDFDFFERDRAQSAFLAEQEIIRTGQPCLSYEEEGKSVDGRISWVLTSKMLWSDKDGTIIGTMGMSRDITERKAAEAELEETSRQLLETSRLAGMAEVATSVLHNVGNVLNSVNVSCSMATELVRRSRVSSVGKTAALLQEHAGDLGAFLTLDPTGKKLPDYLGKLASRLAEEQEQLLLELQSLGKSIDHIKEVVVMQQSHARIAGVTEIISPRELAETCLRLMETSLTRHGVQVVREYDEKMPPITIEKQKVLQILLNLIRNAKQACNSSANPDKRVSVCVTSAEGKVRFSISDSGVGIAPENFTRIFALGFATKAEGHGFGLHGDALAARQMGGSLTVESPGPGLGACFTLELPIQPIASH